MAISIGWQYGWYGVAARRGEWLAIGSYRQEPGVRPKAFRVFADAGSHSIYSAGYLNYAPDSCYSALCARPYTSNIGYLNYAPDSRYSALCARLYLLLLLQIFIFSASWISSSRKSGCATEIIASHFCHVDKPFKFTLPYSVTT